MRKRKQVMWSVEALQSQRKSNTKAHVYNTRHP